MLLTRLFDEIIRGNNFVEVGILFTFVLRGDGFLIKGAFFVEGGVFELRGEIIVCSVFSLRGKLFFDIVWKKATSFTMTHQMLQPILLEKYISCRGKDVQWHGNDIVFTSAMPEVESMQVEYAFWIQAGERPATRLPEKAPQKHRRNMFWPEKIREQESKCNLHVRPRVMEVYYGDIGGLKSQPWMVTNSRGDV